MLSSLLLSLLCTTALTAPTPQPIPQATNSTDIQIAGAAPESDATAIADGLLATVGMLSGLGQSIETISDNLGTTETALSTQLNIQDTQVAASGCTAMTLIFARGTTEPGNVGLLAGPAFIKALGAMIGANALSVEGVDYPASVAGFLVGGDPQGSQTMALMVSSALVKCPNTKLVMSGYSQGAQLVHNAAKILPAATMAKVSSVLLFGDPNDGQAVANAAGGKTKVICHVGDNICDHGDLVLLPHLTYSKDAVEAATFVAAQASLALGN